MLNHHVDQGTCTILIAAAANPPTFPLPRSHFSSLTSAAAASVRRFNESFSAARGSWEQRCQRTHMKPGKNAREPYKTADGVLPPKSSSLAEAKLVADRQPWQKRLACSWLKPAALGPGKRVHANAIVPCHREQRTSQHKCTANDRTPGVLRC